MIFYDWALHQMTNRGMISHGAIEVMHGIVKNPDFAYGTMVTRWSEHVEDYPKMGLDLLWGCIREVALAYLQKNHPACATMPMFVNPYDVNSFDSDIRKWRNAQREVFSNSDKLGNDEDFILDLKRKFFPHLIIRGPNTCE